MYTIETKPMLIYDGDCNFCQKSVNVMKKIVGDAVDFVPFQSIEPEADNYRYAGITDDEFNQGVKLVIDFDIDVDPEDDYMQGVPDKRVYSSAEAIFRTFAYAGKLTFLLYLYNHFPFFKPVSEFVYRQIAANRKHMPAGCKIAPKI